MEFTSTLSFLLNGKRIDVENPDPTVMLKITDRMHEITDRIHGTHSHSYDSYGYPTLDTPLGLCFSSFFMVGETKPLLAAREKPYRLHIA